MTATSYQYLRDVNQSIIYFLNNEAYVRSGAASYVSNTLKGFFSGLNISLGDVDDLENLVLPSLILRSPEISGGAEEAYGDHIQHENFSYQIFGYMGGQQSHNDNLLERDKLVEDLKSLLEDSEYVTLMQFDGSNVADTGGNIALENVTINFIPPDEQPEAAKYRFVIDFDVEYLKKI